MGKTRKWVKIINNDHSLTLKLINNDYSLTLEIGMIRLSLYDKMTRVSSTMNTVKAAFSKSVIWACRDRMRTYKISFQRIWSPDNCDGIQTSEPQLAKTLVHLFCGASINRLLCSISLKREYLSRVPVCAEVKSLGSLSGFKACHP